MIACMASTTRRNICYIDSGASSHMTGQKRFFRDLQEGGTGIHVELGDDARYQAQGVGTISFKRESGKPLCNTPVLTPFALNVYDVYIVINHGVEL